MKRLTLCTAFLLGFLVPYGVAATRPAAKPAPGTKPSRHQDQKVIQGLETTWMKALQAHDAAPLESIIADDFMNISSNGTLSDKTQYLDRIRKGIVHINTIQLVEQKIRVINDVAIVTSLTQVDSVQYGAPVRGMFRYTRVYRYTSSGWKAVNFEATRVSGPGQSNEMSGGVPIKKEIPVRKN